MPGFSEDSAKRIARSVRYTERLQGVPSTDPNENYGAASGNQMCLVRTDATLPAGYTGAMGAPGQVIEKQANGTINKLGAIWIKDQNGGTLSPNTIYQARIGGTWTQDVTTNGIVKPTTLGLYLVQNSGGAAGKVVESFIVNFNWRFDQGYLNRGVVGIIDSDSLPMFPPNINELIGVVRLSQYGNAFDWMGMDQNKSSLPYLKISGRKTGKTFLLTNGNTLPEYSVVSCGGLYGSLLVSGNTLSSNVNFRQNGTVKIIFPSGAQIWIEQLLDYVQPAEINVWVQVAFDLSRLGWVVTGRVPAAPTTGGIGSGIGSGISGV